MGKATVDIKSNKTVGRIFEVPCAECRRDTKHKVLASADEHGEQEMGVGGPTYQWMLENQIVQCQGCDTISFRRTSSNSEDYVQGEDGGYEVAETIALFPSRNAGRGSIKDAALLPSNVGRIYEETIKAMNNDQAVLTGIGIRALIETVCRDKKAAGVNLLKKIDSLVKLGVLSPEGATILHKVRTLGNLAAHEVKPHKPEQLALAMDVVENTLQSVYILPHHAKNTFK